MRLLGILLLLGGFGCLGFSIFDFFTLQGMEEPKYFWLGFVGMPMIFIGFVLNGSAIQRYMFNQQKDTLRDTMKVVGEGLREGLEPESTSAFCTKCGHSVKRTDKFCSSCGGSL
ncbi:zinc ribbon domain-containing protein [Bacillus timonensis]|nr:zinc ribbon domain-containing protein [Bacillus timonensis]